MPEAARCNTPEAVSQALAPARGAGLIPAFPFGTDLTELEQALGVRLMRAKAAQAHPPALASFTRALAAQPDGITTAMLARLGLTHPHSLEQSISAALVEGAA